MTLVGRPRSGWQATGFYERRFAEGDSIDVLWLARIICGWFGWTPRVGSTEAEDVIYLATVSGILILTERDYYKLVEGKTPDDLREVGRMFDAERRLGGHP